MCSRVYATFFYAPGQQVAPPTTFVESTKTAQPSSGQSSSQETRHRMLMPQFLAAADNNSSDFYRQLTGLPHCGGVAMAFASWGQKQTAWMPLGWLQGRAVVDAGFVDYCVCQGGKRPIRLGSGDGSANKKRLTH